MDAYDPDRSDIRYTKAEVMAARLSRPSPVAIGQRVLYRHNHHGDVTDALVLDLIHDNPDQMLLNGLVVPIPPWPTLLLDTVFGEFKTREARCRGSAGWLPVSWLERDTTVNDLHARRLAQTHREELLAG